MKMSDKLIRSGCEHKVSYAPPDFCPQCRIAELEQDKRNVREWTRKHRALISYVAETHSIPAFMLEELTDE
jgi:hypothetical protein